MKTFFFITFLFALNVSAKALTCYADNKESCGNRFTVPTESKPGQTDQCLDCEVTAKNIPLLSSTTYTGQSSNESSGSTGQAE